MKLLHVLATRCHPQELFRTNEYKSNQLISVLRRPYWIDQNIKILKHTKLINIKL
jgi:hypothetical protein